MATAIAHPVVITIHPLFSAFERRSRHAATTPSPSKTRSRVPISSATNSFMRSLPFLGVNLRPMSIRGNVGKARRLLVGGAPSELKTSAARPVAPRKAFRPSCRVQRNHQARRQVFEAARGWRWAGPPCRPHLGRRRWRYKDYLQAWGGPRYRKRNYCRGSRG